MNQESVNAATGMTDAEMRLFVRNHFEEFVNRKNLDIADVNFAPEFIDHGADVPAGFAQRPGWRQAVRRRRLQEVSRYSRRDSGSDRGW
jgi:hypothetical protein